MKKFVILAGLAVVAMTSCSKTEGVLTTQQQTESAISFQPLAAVQTKSTPIREYVEGTGSFNVYAWYQASATSTNFDPSKELTLYMNNVTCEYKAVGDIDKGEDAKGENTWMPANVYYWPKNGKLTFSAYYPTTISDKVEVTAANGIKISDYTVSNPSDQIDVMFSDRAYDRYSTTQSDYVKEYDGVDIVFNHALSAASFTVKAADDYVDDAIKLRKIEVVDALTTGTFSENLNNGYVVDGTHNPEWTWAADTKNYTIDTEEGDGKTVTKDGWQAGVDCIFLPQVFSDKIAIKVTYAIKYIDGTETKYLEQTAVFPLKDTTTGDPATAITAWEMGKWYKYTFTFTLDKIYFAPSVKDWDEVKVNPIEVVKK